MYYISKVPYNVVGGTLLLYWLSREGFLFLMDKFFVAGFEHFYKRFLLVRRHIWFTSLEL